MNSIFRRLPLSVKLLLIGLIPLSLLVYTSVQIYAEKTEKINLLTGYIQRIYQSASINTLIDCLEKERKLSFDHAMKIDKRNELAIQRPRTDSAIQRLEEGSLSGFTTYTFLDNLQKVRNEVDSGYLPPGQVMHYYTTAIFRINTLNTVSPGSEIFLQSVYKDLVGEKLLSEMITNLGIMRSNIYNVLYTKKYMVETLVGMIGVHDVYKTYETEFLVKASPEAIQVYKKRRDSIALKQTVAYLDTLFTHFKPDSSYTAENWWGISNEGMEQLTRLRQELWGNVIAGTNSIIKKETTEKNRTLVFLALALLFVVGIVVYALVRMKNNLLENMRVIRESNEQLHKSAEKYKTIFYQSPLPKWIYDYETLRILDVNEAAIRHYGYSREEFSAMTLKDIRPGEDQEKLVRHIEEIKVKPDTNRGYWRHIKKNGEVIIVEITAHSIDYNDRKARIAVMIDITEKIKAEEKLAASEERFRSIIEQFPYPVINYEPGGACIAANKAWEMMWQDERENVIGYNIRRDPQMIASGLSRCVEKAFAGELSISEPYLYDPALIGQKGRKRWMVMTLYPLKNRGGELMEVVLILRDITESKNAEEVLRNSEEKRRLIMNAALDAIVSIDTQGIITFWNPQSEKIFGWKEKEIKGELFTETIIPVKYRDRYKKGMTHYLQTGETPVLNKLIEITMINRDGREFPAEFSIIPVEQGDEKSFCAFIRDISERKEAEKKLKQSHEELRQLASHLQDIRENERATMAREVHDELGQQITCIKMDVSWLIKRIRTEDPAEQEKIKEIPQLLDHAAMSIRKIATELRPSILDDFGLVDALDWQSREFEKRSGITIQFQSAVPAVSIAPNITTALFRIFQESLTNVARHAAATIINVMIELRDNQFILTIRDNGKGFDITGISDKKTLGLLGMKERTEMIGGEYKISSVPGEGTAVTVVVPLKIMEENNS
ncbi:MAG: PAS domain S-box protein [Bacteroidota bacterium]|nr:PAS domain S-box protein [Bacteroidota bacterium]